MDDSDIIRLYLSRSEKAISETDKKYGKVCRTTARNILGSPEDSEECVNDTYLRVWDIIPPQRPSRLGSFVIRIARNLAVNMFKSRETLKKGAGYKAVGFDEIAQFLPALETVESAVDRKAVLSAIESFLRTLPEEKRIMFVRRYFYCSTYAQIAVDLKMTESAVTMSLRRTREKLREFLETEGIEI